MHSASFNLRHYSVWTFRLRSCSHLRALSLCLSFSLLVSPSLCISHFILSFSQSEIALFHSIFSLFIVSSAVRILNSTSFAQIVVAVVVVSFFKQEQKLSQG